MRTLLSAPLSSRKLVEYLLLFLLLASVLSAAVYGGYWYGKQQVVTPSQTAAPKAKEPTPPEADDETVGWKSYINETYNYEVKIPPGWVYREFPGTKSGAAFRPPDLPNEINSEVIKVDAGDRPLNKQGVPFESYVREAAAQEIQGYETLYSIEETITKSGVKGYKTRWNYRFLSDPPRVSLPITYFDTGRKDGKTVQVSLGNEDYMDVYDQILSTFRFLDQAADETAGWRTLENTQAIVKYNLKYPQSWALDHEVGPRGAGYGPRDNVILSKGNYKLTIYQDETRLGGYVSCANDGKGTTLSLGGKSALRVRSEATNRYTSSSEESALYFVCEESGEGFSKNTSLGEITYWVPENASGETLLEMDSIISTLGLL